jgi:FtsP/CotA-like multicopper oxidase with cupredoxin domain
MGLEPLDRREFLAGGGLLVCTLAGHKLFRDRPADVDRLAAEVPVPPKVTDREARVASRERSGKRATAVLAEGPSGRREYWIQAEPVRWNIVPTHRDQMMGKRVPGRTRFVALAYRRYTADFAAPVGRATIPGPLIEAEVGDQVVVNFRNKLRTPVTIHPHGVFYANEMDGAYKGKFTDPGGFVQHGRTFRYVWEAHPGTEGAWLYHDHGPMDPVPVFKGLFGPLIVRPSGGPVPDREFFLAFHSFPPLATHLNRSFSCVNGRSYAGNTPNLTAKVGDSVAFHVFAIDNAFHTFHVHGHRWVDPNGGQVIDNETLGPGDSITAAWIEDNPGRWFYHCHVFTHLHMGMNGWYVVS